MKNHQLGWWILIDLDALGDIDHSLIYENFDKLHLNDLLWSRDYFENHRKEEFSQEEESFKSYYAYIHLIRNGITTAMPITSVICKKNAETYEEIENAAKNAARLGLRVYLGPSFLMKKPVYDNNERIWLDISDEEKEEGLSNAEKFVKDYDYSFDGLVRGAVVPERIEQQSEESLIRSKKIADKYNVPLRLHAAQSEYEYKHIYNREGLSSIAYLDKLNILSNKTLIPHCIFTSGSSYISEKGDNDLDLLHKSNTSIIHCPLVFAREGTALESFGRFLRKGVNITMGTDTFPCDMIENIKLGSLIAKILDGDYAENGVLSFFNAATLNGSLALGRNDLGRLETGCKADMIIIDLEDFDLGVVDMPLTSVLLNGSGRLVKTSIINGKVVMRNRIILGIDTDELKHKANKIYKHMKHTYYKRSSNKELSEYDFFGKR